MNPSNSGFGRQHTLRVCLAMVLLLTCGYAIAMNPPVWAAPASVRPNQTLPPFTYHVELPLVATSPMPVNITHHPAKDFSPAWSPDGSHLAFLSDRDGNTELYVMLMDGSHVNQLTDELSVPGPAENYDWCLLDATWPPDGQQVAFSIETCPPLQPGTHDPYATYIYTSDAEGGTPRPLNRYGRGPVWSPDGKKLAYTVPSSAYWQPLTYYLCAASIDGSDVSVCAERGFAPDWSPDTTRIAFAQRIDATARLVTVNADGSNYNTIFADDDHFVDSPKWSPDGSQIAYLSQGVFSYSLRAVNPDIGTPSTLMRVEWQRIFALAWLTNRNCLIFWGEDANGLLTSGFYLFDLDGHDFQLILTLDLPSDAEAVVWSADRTKVAYTHDGDIYVLKVPHE